MLCSGTSNAKSYVVQRDVGGRTRRVRIGAVAELKLAKAKERAAGALDDLRRGIDPANRAAANMTLKAALIELCGISEATSGNVTKLVSKQSA